MFGKRVIQSSIFCIFAVVTISGCGKNINDNEKEILEETTYNSEMAEETTYNSEIAEDIFESQHDDNNEQENEIDFSNVEPMKEVLNASFTERKMQIYDVVFELGSSLSDFLKVVSKSKLKYEFKEDNEYIKKNEYLPGCTGVLFNLYYEDEVALVIFVENPLSEKMKLSDCIVNYVDLPNEDVFTNEIIYYAKGLKINGEGLTYDSAKELVKLDGSGEVIEDSDDNYQYVILHYTNTINSIKGHNDLNNDCYLFIGFDLEGHCVGITDQAIATGDKIKIYNYFSNIYSDN